MAQPEFIAKPPKERIKQPTGIAYSWPQNYKTKSVSKVGGFNFAHSDPTGTYDHSKLRVELKRKSLQDGHEHTMMGCVYAVPPTAADLKKYVRRIRPQEAAELDEIDSQIEVLKARRAEVLQKAWTNGHTIPFTEVKPQIKNGY